MIGLFLRAGRPVIRGAEEPANSQKVAAQKRMCPHCECKAGTAWMLLGVVKDVSNQCGSEIP